MQTMLQLNPPIPLNTPKGEGLAVLVSDYGPDFDLWWTVIVTKGEFAGQVWTYPNPEVRGVANVTLGRRPINGLELPQPQHARGTNGHAQKPETAKLNRMD